jgi:hypothetical protein
MIVRLRFGLGGAVSRKPRKNRHLALGCAALLAPTSLMAYVLGLWRLTSDLGATAQFTITGVFSHWQVWIAMAAAMHLAAYVLNRYGRGDGELIPRILIPRFGKPRPESR